MAKDKKRSLQVRKKECITEMKDIMRLIGYWNVNKTSLARKYEVEWRSVDKWFTDILTRIPNEQINNIKIMAEASIKNSMAVCERIMADPAARAREKLDAVSKLNETMKHYTDFLEKYGLKQKVAEELKVGVSGVLDIDRLLQIAQEDKDVNSEKKD